MAGTLEGKKIAFLVANEGVEQVELTEPWGEARRQGAQPELIAPDAGQVQAFNHLDKADTFPGRTLTSWPSVQTDIRNAGGDWVDEEVVVDQGLVTSRKPDDIPAFNAKMVEEFAEGKHAEQREKTLHAEATPS